MLAVNLDANRHSHAATAPSSGSNICIPISVAFWRAFRLLLNYLPVCVFPAQPCARYFVTRIFYKNGATTTKSGKRYDRAYLSAIRFHCPLIFHHHFALREKIYGKIPKKAFGAFFFWKINTKLTTSWKSMNESLRTAAIFPDWL